MCQGFMKCSQERLWGQKRGGKIDKGVTSGEVSLSLSRGALDHTNKASTRSLLESRGWTFIVTPVRHWPRFLDCRARASSKYGNAQLQALPALCLDNMAPAAQSYAFGENHRKPLETKEGRSCGRGGTWVEVSGHYRG